MLDLAALLGSVGVLLGSLALLILSLAVYSRLTYQVPNAPRIPGLGPKPDPEIPDGLQEWIDRESEPWARESLRTQAVREYQELGDWAAVEMRLRTTLADTPDPTSSIQGM